MYFVSRQRYWSTGENVVEIAAGGLDHSGPDMLSDHFNIYARLGSGLETDDPREALRAAVAIRDEWNRQLEAAYAADECSLSDPISCRIEVGYNLDMITPAEEPTDEQLQEWAQQEWDSLPTCYWCGERGDLPYYIPEIGEEVRFCSSACADECWAKEVYNGELYVSLENTVWGSTCEALRAAKEALRAAKEALRAAKEAL